MPSSAGKGRVGALGLRPRLGPGPRGLHEPEPFGLRRKLPAGRSFMVVRAPVRGKAAERQTHTGFHLLFQLTLRGGLTIRTGVALPLGERRAVLFEALRFIEPPPSSGGVSRGAKDWSRRGARVAKGDGL